MPLSFQLMIPFSFLFNTLVSLLIHPFLVFNFTILFIQSSFLQKYSFNSFSPSTPLVINQMATAHGSILFTFRSWAPSNQPPGATTTAAGQPTPRIVCHPKNKPRPPPKTTFPELYLTVTAVFYMTYAAIEWISVLTDLKHSLTLRTVFMEFIDVCALEINWGILIALDNVLARLKKENKKKKAQ